jgi:hypothetical protein
MSEQPFESAEPAATPPGIPPSAPPPGPPFDQPPPKAEKPRWKQVAIMFFGGLVLAAGGCAMFLAGVLVLAVGGITGLVYMLQALFRSGKR